MWTTKKELQTALKLAAEAKTEKFIPFIDIGPCMPIDSEPASGIDSMQEKLGNIRWFGKCEMRSCCTGYEARFLFQDTIEGKIRVSYEHLKDAVRGLDKREVELKIHNGELHIFQGQEDIVIRELVLSDEMLDAVPEFIFDPVLKRRLNGYELAGTVDVLSQLICLPEKEPRYNSSSGAITFENRAGFEKTYEDLLVSAGNGMTLGVGRQNLDNWGELGVFMLPANAARRIVHTHKLLHPAGVEISFGKEQAAFDFGRYKMTCRLMDTDFINPDLAVPRDVQAVFEFTRDGLLNFCKKATIFGPNVNFSYEAGSFNVVAGSYYSNISGRLENGARQRPSTESFMFILNAAELLNVLRSIHDVRVELCYGGAENPVWLRAGRMNYAFCTQKPQQENKNG